MSITCCIYFNNLIYTDQGDLEEWNGDLVDKAMHLTYMTWF